MWKFKSMFVSLSFSLFYNMILFQCAGFFYVNNDNRIARAQCPHCQFQQCEQCCRKVN
jgi:hypothetical protein